MANLNASNTFTPEVVKTDMSPVNLSVSGTWSGTVTVQRSRVNENIWVDIENFTANVEKDGRVAGDWKFRAGFKAGNYGSGTAVVNVY